MCPVFCIFFEWSDIGINKKRERKKKRPFSTCLLTAVISDIIKS